MKWSGLFVGFFLTLSPLASAGPVLLPGVKPQCEKTDCLKAAIEGRRPGGPGDCKRFMQVTVFPKTVIVASTTFITRVTSAVETLQVVTTDVITTSVATSTLTESNTVTTLLTLQKRQTETNQPVTSSRTDLPRYASMCGDAKQFVSACSCVGHKPITTTLATPTSHVVVTSYVDETTSIQTTAVATEVTATTNTVATQTVSMDTVETEAAFPDRPCTRSAPFALRVFVDDFNFEGVNGTYSGRYGQEEMYFYLTSPENRNAMEYVRDEQCSLAYAGYVDFQNVTNPNNGTNHHHNRTHHHHNGTHHHHNGTHHHHNGTHHHHNNGTHHHHNGTLQDRGIHQNNGTNPSSRARVMNGTVTTNQTLPARSRVRLEPDGAGRIVIDDRYGDVAQSSSSSSSGSSSPSSSASSSESTAASFSHTNQPNELPIVEFAFNGDQLFAKIRGLDFSDTKLQIDADGALFINPANFDNPNYTDVVLMSVDV